MKTHIINTVLKIIICCFVFALSSILSAGEYFVTNTKDSGPGSLREAIYLANTNAGPDAIFFQVAKSDSGYDQQTGVWTIKPISELPTITDSSLAIYGQSQSEFIGEDTNPFGPEIELDGSLSQGDGLEIQSSHIEIHHLVFNQFGNSCIQLKQATDCHIAGCYIGTDPTGMEAIGKLFGIIITDHSMRNEIVPMDTIPNIISGNPWGGIMISYTSHFNIVFGNLIGLNRTMDDTLPNGLGGGYGGVYLGWQSDHNEVINNHICGNNAGVGITESNDNIIANNYIGTNETWQTQLGNHYYGITICGEDDTTMNNLIIENTIGYNGSYGIGVDGGLAIQNTITRNSISGNSGGISTSNGGNTGLAPPTIFSATTTSVQGTAGPNMTIEIFEDPVSQGQIFLGETTSDGSGNFTLPITVENSSDNITATATDASGNTSAFSLPVTVVTDVDRSAFVPVRFELKQNYPNPFNPSTRISFHIPENGRVILSIYNTLGEKIETVFDRFATAGNYDVVWNPQNITSGIYLCRLQMGKAITIRKMTLVR